MCEGESDWEYKEVRQFRGTTFDGSEDFRIRVGKSIGRVRHRCAITIDRFSRKNGSFVWYLPCPSVLSIQCMESTRVNDGNASPSLSLLRHYHPVVLNRLHFGSDMLLVRLESVRCGDLDTNVGPGVREWFSLQVSYSTYCNGGMRACLYPVGLPQASSPSRGSCFKEVLL